MTDRQTTLVIEQIYIGAQILNSKDDKVRTSTFRLHWSGALRTLFYKRVLEITLLTRRCKIKETSTILGIPDGQDMKGRGTWINDNDNDDDVEERFTLSTVIES